MTVVDDAVAALKRYDKWFKLTIVAAYGSGLLLFILALPHFGTATVDFILLMAIAVVLYPYVIVMMAERHRLMLILKLSIAILSYINEQYGDKIGPIPLNGIEMPLGEKK